VFVCFFVSLFISDYLFIFLIIFIHPFFYGLLNDVFSILYFIGSNDRMVREYTRRIGKVSYHVYLDLRGMK
jgi:hypothetical protein